MDFSVTVRQKDATDGGVVEVVAYARSLKEISVIAEALSGQYPNAEVKVWELQRDVESGSVVWKHKWTEMTGTVMTVVDVPIRKGGS